MKIKPAGPRLIVKLKKAEEKTSDGIYLAAESLQDLRTKAMQEAYVIEIGPTAFEGWSPSNLPWCAIGDLVYTAKYSGEDIIDHDTGEIYRIINDNDVLAVLTED